MSCPRSARRNEIDGLRWSEIDLQNRTINLQGERTKNGRGHVIPLSKPAHALLSAVPPAAGRDYVFGRAEGFSGWSVSNSQLDARLKIAQWGLHDLRRTAVTGMAELGVQPHIIEAVVNH
jgi:integrase